ncbi:MAG TPA: hypothetical protein VFL14_07185 [Xanthomonadales bacterium]|nr:hypothetical protein [Xanthomonadales bacterium]
MTERLRLPFLLAAMFAAAAASAADPAQSDAQRIAELEKRIAALEEKVNEPPELGRAMLEIQIRHARLWFAGIAKNWTLAAFQLAELNEAFKGVVAENADDPTMQPARLADVLPAMMDPGIKAVREAIDAKDAKKFAIAYDQLTNGCNACHTAASFDFNRFGRPKTPQLDNQLYDPAKR